MFKNEDHALILEAEKKAENGKVSALEDLVLIYMTRNEEIRPHYYEKALALFEQARMQKDHIRMYAIKNVFHDTAYFSEGTQMEKQILISLKETIGKEAVMAGAYEKLALAVKEAR